MQKYVTQPELKFVQIEYTRPKLTTYQTNILNSKARYTITSASTKTGKTASHIIWLFEQALALTIKKIDHSWAGLRTFAKDGSPVIGEDPLMPNFYWLAGQGGHGIQIAPAAAQLLASLAADRPLPESFKRENFDPAWVSPARLITK